MAGVIAKKKPNDPQIMMVKKKITAFTELMTDIITKFDVCLSALF
jgi:hypothetical protein